MSNQRKNRCKHAQKNIFIRLSKETKTLTNVKCHLKGMIEEMLTCF